MRTILGVSNISFGLPCRSYLNTTFLTMAMYAGLDLAIMNPSSEEMMAAVYAYNVLTNRDRQSTKYIERYANRVPASAALVQAVQNAQTILLYAAFGGEAGLAGFAAEAARRGKVLAYPVCGENCSLTAAVPGPDGWETGLYGIRTPVLERSVLLEPEQLDLVLVPCTAFDAACRRVGMGKGYYDRYLPRMPECRGAGRGL